MINSRATGGINLIALAFLSAGPVFAQSSWNISGESLTVRGTYLSISSVRPTLTLVCRDGKLVSSSFNTFIAPGRASERGFIRKSEKAPVLFRVGEQKEKFKRWQLADGSKSLHPDVKFVKDFISSEHTVIEFITSDSGEMAAQFDPSMADLPRIRKACGIR